MKLPNLPEALGNKTDISDSDESDQNDVEKSELKIVAGLEIMEWFELNISYVMALCFASAILRNQKSLEGIVTERIIYI